MGSGAFLVEACRQLADALIESWRAHDAVPEIPADENEWLITLAKDHPPHLSGPRLAARRLVGRPVAAADRGVSLERGRAAVPGRLRRSCGSAQHLAKIAALRERIRESGEEVSDQERRLWWRDARDELDAAGVHGDLVLAAFFEKARMATKRNRAVGLSRVGRGGLARSCWRLSRRT